MALVQALSTAITGLSSHQTALDTIGDNIANVNTTAYKKGVYSFSTLLSTTLEGGTEGDEDTGSTNPSSLGLGTQISSVTNDYTQGSLEETGNVRDMAISGNGYFVLRSGNSYVYTRDGSFYLGSDGSLLASDGLHVQGVMADEDGNISESASIEDIYIEIGTTGGATETSEVSFTGNLDYDEDVAVGLMLTSSSTTGTDAEDILENADSTDTTWSQLVTDATNGELSVINGGSVQTSSALASYDSTTGTYSTASLTTDLADLCYLDGETWVQPFAGITDGEEISITFDKGETQYTVTFVYDSSASSTTLQDFLEFLAGDVDNTAIVDEDTTDATDTSIENLESLTNTSTEGGAMGLVDVAANVSTADGGTSDYNTPVETAGAFSRSGISQVDLNGTGTTVDSFNVSIVSNLGTENSISDISVSYNNVTYTEMFDDDTDYGDTTGGSTTTTFVVYDSVGEEHTVTLTLTLVDRDSNFSTYRWVATSEDDTDAEWLTDALGNITTSSIVGTGTIQFDADGNFVSGSELSETGGIEITLENEGVSSTIQIDIQEGLAGDQTQDLDFSALTQISSDTDLTLADQNGSAPGTLESFTVSDDGTIQGVYSNGVVEDIARIVIALIPNENGLIEAGDNLYYTSASSGDAQIGFAGVGGRGSVQSGYLESSNVDLSDEFTDLITIQRGYQANARVITTADEMLQELVNLTR